MNWNNKLCKLKLRQTTYRKTNPDPEFQFRNCALGINIKIIESFKLKLKHHHSLTIVAFDPRAQRNVKCKMFFNFKIG